jgi:hypothetical protein
VDENNKTISNQTAILEPQKETEIQITFIIESNENKYKFILEKDSINLTFPVWTFGYHLSLNEICDNLAFKQNQDIIYFRQGNEALLKIFNEKKEKELKTISLAREITYIDLREFRPNKYSFCTIDYSTKKQKCCIIMIEK